MSSADVLPSVLSVKVRKVFAVGNSPVVPEITVNLRDMALEWRFRRLLFLWTDLGIFIQTRLSGGWGVKISWGFELILVIPGIRAER